MITIRPYGFPYLNNMVLGRDLAVVAGTATLLGCYNVNVQVWAALVVNLCSLLRRRCTGTMALITSVHSLQSQAVLFGIWPS